MLAARDGHKEVVKILLEAGSDVQVANNEDNKTALDLAANSDIRDMIKEHIRQGEEM